MAWGTGRAAWTDAREVSEFELNAYVDGALEPARQAKVEAFLATHAGEAARVRAYLWQTDALNALFTPAARMLPPPLEDLARRYAQAMRHRRGQA